MRDQDGYIRKLRKDCFPRVTQHQLATFCGVSKITYQRIEYGQREGSTSFWVKLAEFYDITLDQLFERIIPKTKRDSNEIPEKQVVL